MSTRRALVFSFLDRYSALLISVASSMVIARLLSPAELGVFSVSMVFIMFISSMRDLGAGQYLVQEKELTPDRIRATWTVLLATGLLMSLLVLAAAYPVAHFFGEPQMVAIMCVISLNFAVNPLGSLTYAWLMREMRFDALTMMRFCSSLAGAATSITLAHAGYGAISLAWGNLVATLVNAAVSLRYRPHAFSWGIGTKEIRRVIGFGGRISATSVVLNIGAGAPEFLLGKLQGLSAAGLYSRGNGLVTMFQKLVLDATNAVALPLLARAQRETGNITPPFLRALSYVTALGWTFFAGVALLGYPLIRLLYGWQWDESVPLMRFLALGMALGLPAAMCSPALMAAGSASTILRVSMTVIPLQVLAIGAGAWFSLTGAGVGYAAAQALVAPIWLYVCRRHCGLPLGEVARALASSLALAALTSLVPLACVALWGWQPASSLTVVLTCGAVGVPVFVLAARVLGHPIYQEIAWIAGKIPRPGKR